ncbi:alpha/beta fold hydrolase [Cellulomonas sp. B6]|uniref:alpha/beta fold hydrolase n=1 Tax=Cellulomonas sp. B6 TaxID=1295626 RepID=UPI000AA33976|nr:alpha/beta hydrolase [Cellulomonas sp. B6]
MSVAVERWLALPGLGCPPSTFDGVRTLLPASVHLDVRDRHLTASVEDLLADGPVDGVVGHSLGGLLALEAALREPERVGRVVLLDPTRPHEQGPAGPVRAAALATARAATRAPGAEVLASAVDRAAARWWRRRGVTSTGDAAPGTAGWRSLLDELDAGWDRAARVDALLTAGPPRVPVVLAVPERHGRREQRADVLLARRTAARLVRVARTGHLVPCDRPDAVAELLVGGPEPA